MTICLSSLLASSRFGASSTIQNATAKTAIPSIATISRFEELSWSFISAFFPGAFGRAFGGFPRGGIGTSSRRHRRFFFPRRTERNRGGVKDDDDFEPGDELPGPAVAGAAAAFRRDA